MYHYKQNFALLNEIGTFLLFTQCMETEHTPTSSQSIQLEEILKLERGQEVDFITNFQFDKSGDLWVGTFSSGIYQVKVGSTINFSTANSLLPDDRINDLFIDTYNKLWVATDSGFASFQNTTWELFNDKNIPLTNNTIHQIAINSNNEVLVGYGNVENGGLLLRTQGGNWTTLTTMNSNLPCNLILDIETSEKGNFWASTAQFMGQGGVVKIENEKIIQVLNTENSDLLYNWIDNIEVTPE